MGDTPTQDQLRTLCNRVSAALEAGRMRFQELQQQAEDCRMALLSLQGMLAALQVATGKQYDPTSIPMDLELD